VIEAEKGGGGRFGSEVLVSYEYEGRSYESWVHCSHSRCDPGEVLDVWVDPQRPDRFASEYSEINDDGWPQWRSMLMYTSVMVGLGVVISLLTSVSEDPARQARYRQARRRRS
jgi:hypothetical protein